MNTTALLTRILRAADRRHPVTISYTKEDGSPTVRTIEIYDAYPSGKGHILLTAMDRETAERRSFKLAEITKITVHRGTTYRVPVGDAITPAEPITDVDEFIDSVLDSDYARDAVQPEPWSVYA